MSDHFDVIIFGASGYTGKRIVFVFSEIVLKANQQLKWAVAARSEIKMKNELEELKKLTGAIPSDLPIITADTTNESSLLAMTTKGRLLINCTGPSKLCGNPIIQACIRNNCHYIDITAEPFFMEKAQLQFNAEALSRRVYVILGCGMESILADMGLNFVQKEFDGTLNSVECYLEILLDNDRSFFSSSLTSTSWNTHINVLQDLRFRKLEKRNNGLKPELCLRKLPHKVPNSVNLALPYPCADTTVMRMSQQQFFKQRQSRPIQVQMYFASSKFFHIVVALLGFFFIYFVTAFSCVTNILLKHPRFFSAGFCGKDPVKTETSKMKIVMTHYGRGWKNKKVDEDFEEAEDSSIISKMTARDPYHITAICLVCSALVLLNEAQTLRQEGGVYTPAVFFDNTNLIDCLRQNGIDFQIHPLDVNKGGDTI